MRTMGAEANGSLKREFQRINRFDATFVCETNRIEHTPTHTEHTEHTYKHMKTHIQTHEDTKIANTSADRSHKHQLVDAVIKTKASSTPCQRGF